MKRRATVNSLRDLVIKPRVILAAQALIVVVHAPMGGLQLLHFKTEP